MNTNADNTPHRSTADLGEWLLYASIGLIVLRLIEQTRPLPGFPGFWAENHALWMIIALIGAAGSCWLIVRDGVGKADGHEHSDDPPRHGPSAAQPAALHWRPSQPGRRFNRLVVYSKSDCPLCDEALAVLQRYQAWLPSVELVPIDDDPDLKERYGDSVPVVVVDGATRFRGRINELLLERLIEGSQPGN